MKDLVLETLVKLAIPIMLFGACDRKADPRPDDMVKNSKEAISEHAVSSEKSVDWTYGRILLQPHFYWEDLRDTYNGTAFLTRNDEGAIFGVGSAHYVLGDVLARRAELLEIPTGERIAETNESFGPVGDGDPSTPPQNSSSLAEDFFFLPIDGEVEPNRVIELDQRERVELGEKVWFPNKSRDVERGYHLLQGEVVRVDEGYVSVRIDERFHAQSQSGTPVISKKTGKAIGTWAGYDESGKLPFIYLAPAHALHAALHSGRERMPLTEALQAENGTGSD